MTNQMRNTLSTVMTAYNKLRISRSPLFARRALSAMMKAYWAMVRGKLETGRLNRAIEIFTHHSRDGRHTVKYFTTRSFCTCPDYKYRKHMCKHIIAFQLGALSF